MHHYGLIGKTLKHSFSKGYFEKKFEKENIPDATYKLYELEEISGVEELFHDKNLKGFNVTVPYKLDILPYLNQLDESAQKVGAVNVVKINADGSKTGYNSDYYGFRQSLKNWVDLNRITSALVLGTGGASKAVIETLKDLNLETTIVSRSGSNGNITYKKLNDDPKYYEDHQLIINCTPVGTFPDIEASPELNYTLINSNHYLYDLVYNPKETKFMQLGKKQKAQVKNGLEMLHLQAEKSWEIWNQETF